MGYNGGQIRFRGMNLPWRSLGISQVALLNDIFCIAGAADHAISYRKEQRIKVMIGFFETFLLYHVLSLPSQCSQAVIRLSISCSLSFFGGTFLTLQNCSSLRYTLH